MIKDIETRDNQCIFVTLVETNSQNPTAQIKDATQTIRGKSIKLK